MIWKLISMPRRELFFLVWCGSFACGAALFGSAKLRCPLSVFVPQASGYAGGTRQESGACWLRRAGICAPAGICHTRLSARIRQASKRPGLMNSNQSAGDHDANGRWACRRLREEDLDSICELDKRSYGGEVFPREPSSTPVLRMSLRYHLSGSFG